MIFRIILEFAAIFPITAGVPTKRQMQFFYISNTELKFNITEMKDCNDNHHHKIRRWLTVCARSFFRFLERFLSSIINSLISGSSNLVETAEIITVFID
jgi:hypothetical protein